MKTKERGKLIYMSNVIKHYYVCINYIQDCIATLRYVNVDLYP